MVVHGKFMNNTQHPECHARHINWAAAAVAVTLLCGLFALIGYIISDRTGIASEAAKDATRITALEQQSADYQKKIDHIIPSLARIEQSLADLKETIGQSSHTHSNYAQDPPVASSYGGGANTDMGTAKAPHKLMTNHN
jgi:septal ring factor EnvC (AmiA/AmiB activator)